MRVAKKGAGIKYWTRVIAGIPVVVLVGVVVEKADIEPVRFGVGGFGVVDNVAVVMDDMLIVSSRLVVQWICAVIVGRCSFGFVIPTTSPDTVGPQHLAKGVGLIVFIVTGGVGAIGMSVVEGIGGVRVSWFINREQLKDQCSAGFRQPREQVTGGPSGEVGEGKKAQEWLVRGEGDVQFVALTTGVDVLGKQC